jgi:ribosomal protein S18 acetylase RimI-like enzyme
MKAGMTESPKIQIRPARREDLLAIVRMLADDPLGRDREMVAEPLSDVYLRAFEDLTADPRNALVVAEGAEGTVLGCLQLTFIPGLSYRGAERALIEDVRVDARHRGRRIGHRMLEWAITEARLRRCRLVQLFVHETRTEAHRFYGDLGFRHHHSGMRLYLD